MAIYAQKRTMLCPFCLHNDTRVVDKRDSEGISKRRRECLKCSKRFNTLEEVEKLMLRVIKKDGRREAFDPQKIRRGIETACEKRPISTQKMDKMIGKIEERIMRKGKEVRSDFIGELVSRELKRLDNVAYIRFASVYRDFTDISDFKKEIKGLVSKK